MAISLPGLVELHIDASWGYTIRTVNGIPLTFTKNPELTVNDPKKKAKKTSRKRQEEAEEEL